MPCRTEILSRNHPETTCTKNSPAARKLRSPMGSANAVRMRSVSFKYMAKDRDGRDVFLADSGYVLQMAQMDFKHIKFHFTSEF